MVGSSDAGLRLSTDDAANGQLPAGIAALGAAHGSRPLCAPVGPAIVARLSGGLGNQMFQYAAGRSLAHRTGARLILDATPFTVRHERRRYALAGYGIVADVSFAGCPHPPSAAVVELPPRRGFRLADIMRKVRRRTADPARFSLFTEKSFDYDPAFERLGAQTYLDGYWQSARYFSHIAAAIRRELQPAGEPDRANAQWLARIRAANAVCLHVRRGDYLISPHFEHHGVCSVEYYRRAMARMRDVAAGARFFVFSDDWQWARDQLSASDAIVVDANGPQAGRDELRLMAACRHHVIANSSLSWWAAWLSAQDGQIVIAPAPWFTATPNTPDLLPADWLTLPRA
jgi:glycosyl transferase family 11